MDHGLPASGKSTIAGLVQNHLKSKNLRNWIPKIKYLGVSTKIIIARLDKKGFMYN